MASVDEHTQNAIEIVSEGAKLTSELLLYILKSLSNMLEKGEEKKKIIINDKTKEGKQKIEKLLKKHKNGVESLDANLTKEQLKDYQKEFKKLGVDFSVVKNSKDNYSFFFAAEQASVIEKALKNVIESAEQVRDSEEVKQAKIKVDAEKHHFKEDEIETVEKAYTQTRDISDPTETKEFKELSNKEQNLYIKISELDKIEKKVHDQVTKAFSVMKNGIENEGENHIPENIKNDKDIEKKVNSNRTKEDSKKVLHSKLQNLSENELALFEQRMKYESEATAPKFNATNVYLEANKLDEMQKDFPKEVVKKINGLDNGIRSLSDLDNSKDNSKLTAKEILSEVRNFKDREKEKVADNVFSMKKVREIDKQIKDEAKDKPVVRNKEQSL